MVLNSDRVVVVVGSAPRTGSTWLFNASRLLLQAKGLNGYPSWHEAYDPSNAASWHLVKVHEQADFDFPSDIVLSTKRDAVESVASLIRMGWCADTDEAIYAALLHQFRMTAWWRRRANLQVDYRDLTNKPEDTLRLVAAAMCLTVTDEDIADVLRNMVNITTPDEYDPLTQMHPGHRADESASARFLAKVRAFVDQRSGHDLPEIASEEIDYLGGVIALQDEVGALRVVLEEAKEAERSAVALLEYSALAYERRLSSLMDAEENVYIARGQNVAKVRKARPLLGAILDFAYRAITSAARRLS